MTKYYSPDTLDNIRAFFKDINVSKFCLTYGLGSRYLSSIIKESPQTPLRESYYQRIQFAMLKYIDDKQELFEKMTHKEST